MKGSKSGFRCKACNTSFNPHKLEDETLEDMCSSCRSDKTFDYNEDFDSLLNNIYSVGSISMEDV